MKVKVDVIKKKKWREIKGSGHPREEKMGKLLFLWICVEIVRN